MNNRPNNADRRPINRQGGYTLLFAVLTSALVLGIAVFIVTITAKQYELSAAAKNSMYSFYAADTGVECAAAAYSGYNGGIIDLSTGATVRCYVDSSSAVQTIHSAFSPISSSLAVGQLKGSSNATYATGPMNFNLSNSTCATIVIYDGDASNGDHYTYIESRGYNKCTSSYTPDSGNPATVERALLLGKKS